MTFHTPLRCKTTAVESFVSTWSVINLIAQRTMRLASAAQLRFLHSLGMLRVVDVWMPAFHVFEEHVAQSLGINDVTKSFDGSRSFEKVVDTLTYDTFAQRYAEAHIVLNSCCFKAGFHRPACLVYCMSSFLRHHTCCVVGRRPRNRYHQSSYYQITAVIATPSRISQIFVIAARTLNKGI